MTTTLTTSDISEQPLPKSGSSTLDAVQIGILSAQIAKRIKQSKYTTSTVSVSGSWSGLHNGNCQIEQFDVAGVCVEKLIGVWTGGWQDAEGTWSLTNGTHFIAGSWVNDGAGTITIEAILTGNGMTGSGTLIHNEVTSDPYTFAGTIHVENAGVQTVSVNHGIGKYGLPASLLETIGLLSPGTVERYLAERTTSCSLKEIIKSPVVWNCNQTLDNFLDSDVFQTDAIVEAALELDGNSAEETAERILDAIFPDSDNSEDARYAINLATKPGIGDLMITPVARVTTRPATIKDSFNPSLTDVMQSMIGSAPGPNFTSVPKLPPRDCK